MIQSFQHHFLNHPSWWVCCSKGPSELPASTLFPSALPCWLWAWDLTSLADGTVANTMQAETCKEPGQWGPALAAPGNQQCWGAGWRVICVVQSTLFPPGTLRSCEGDHSRPVSSSQSTADHRVGSMPTPKNLPAPSGPSCHATKSWAK